MNRMIPVLPALLVVASAAGHPHEHPPARPINNTINYDHSYTPAELLEQLRDDDIRGNLRSARQALLTHPDLTVGFLYNALNHEDWQVRQVICFTIWQKTADREAWTPKSKSGEDWAGVDKHIYPADPAYTITEDLIRVTIEGLRDDTTPYDHARHRGLVYFNASFGVSKLIPVAHEWRHLLDQALESEDRQQQFLAAYILARAGVHQSVERVSQILLPHLRDNTIHEDAKHAVFALGGMGPELLPYLKDVLATADQQQRDLVQLLMVNIMDPSFSDQEREQRSHYNSITTTVQDPASQQSMSYWSWMNDL